MNKALAVAALLACALAPPAAAQAKPEPQSPTELLDEAAEKFLRALEMMIKAIPQYEAPTTNENGDIIIRRVRPKTSQPPAPCDGDDCRTRARGTET